MKNGKIANINTTTKNLFFKWLNITKPFHKLSPKELDVLALLLYYNYIYSKEITNDILKWKLLFSSDTKKLIKEELNMGNGSFQNMLTSLRKKNIIKDNKIVSTFIPNLEKDSKVFKIIYSFKIID